MNNENMPSQLLSSLLVGRLWASHAAVLGGTASHSLLAKTY
jgi:hypothetical protein